ncbi:unnamed protein product [Closterium sp. NIES-54]
METPCWYWLHRWSLTTSSHASKSIARPSASSRRRNSDATSRRSKGTTTADERGQPQAEEETVRSRQVELNHKSLTAAACTAAASSCKHCSGQQWQVRLRQQMRRQGWWQVRWQAQR